MLSRLAAAASMASAGVSPTTAPASTTTSTPTTTTTVAVAARSGAAAAHQPVRAANAANPSAYYGDPKVGVEIAPGAPGLYPVFGSGNQPDLSGFTIEAHPATGQTPPPGVSEPQATCPPSTEDSSRLEPASVTVDPNLYCQTDSDNGFEFPMGAPSETYDFSVTAAPMGFVADPDQTVPVSDSVDQCPFGSQGTDNCSIVKFEPQTAYKVEWFDYIGIYRQIEVAVTGPGGTPLSGVAVTLDCRGPAGAPAYACPPSGEKSNVSAASRTTSQAASPSTSSATATTGSNGQAVFAGVYLPGSSLSVTASPPAGYQAASLSSTVPSPVTSATNTGAKISAAAQTPVVLDLSLPKVPPPTTTTTSTTSTTTTTVAATTTTTTARTGAATLPFTGADSTGAAEDAAVLLGTGAVLVAAGRRRRPPKGRHFKRR